MVTNIKMGKFLKTNVLDTISRKYKYDPERSLPYLKEITEQLLEVQALVNETTSYMNRVVRIKDEEQGNVYPFMEGDDYWTIEDGKIIWSCWDDVSEDIFRGNPYKNYFESEAEANNFLKNIGA
jgi:hypothetical protein|tara:strand:- start:632 stop:1003 length:372 start_codon:yes stop_codon:yes gene_type:complete